MVYCDRRHTYRRQNHMEHTKQHEEKRRRNSGEAMNCHICKAPVENFSETDIMPVCAACAAAAKKNTGHWAGTAKEHTVRIAISLQGSPKPASR